MMHTDDKPSAEALRIRTAVAEDASALSLFARAAFLNTFGPDNDPMDMQAYLPGAFSVALQLVEINDPRRVCLLAESGSELVGYALVRRGESAVSKVRDDSHESSVEIQRFYVHQDWHGQGVAARLMQVCVQVARDRRADTIWLSVWERNPRAIRFYQKQGFIDVGTQDFLLGSDLQTDRVMSRPVGDVG